MKKITMMQKANSDLVAGTTLLASNGDSANLLPDLEMYLKGLAVGTPGVVMFSLLIPIVQMNGGGKVVRITVIVGVIVNAVLDILAGTLGWGMLGMGLATSISAWAEYLLLLVYSLSSKSSVHFSYEDADWSKSNKIKAGKQFSACQLFYDRYNYP